MPSKRPLSSPSSTPSRKKKARTLMPLSDVHPMLRHLDTKSERRTECNRLISSIVTSLAAKKPTIKKCAKNHYVEGPILNRGVKNLAKAGEWYILVCFFVS